MPSWWPWRLVRAQTSRRSRALEGTDVAPAHRECAGPYERGSGRLRSDARGGARRAECGSARRSGRRPGRALRLLKEWRLEQAGRLGLDQGLVWPAVSLGRLSTGQVPLNDELESGEVRRWQRRELGESLRSFMQRLIRSRSPSWLEIGQAANRRGARGAGPRDTATATEPV